MRFSIITDTFLPEVNGVAMTLGRLASGLADRGHELEIVRPRRRSRKGGIRGRGQEWAMDARIREWLVPAVPLPCYRGVKFGLPQKRQLHARWRSRLPHALYIATEGLLGWSAAAAAGFADVPFVSGYHTRFSRYLSHYRLPLLARVARRYMMNLHNRASITLAPTRELVAELAQRGYRNVQCLGRGIDLEFFSPDRRSCMLRELWGVADEDVVALYVGRVAPEKNLPQALEAFRWKRATLPGLKMVVVGNGPAHSALKHAYPDVIWAGERKGVDLAAHYASADLFLFPSETETFGNVVLEAMASGLVTVAFNGAAAAEAIVDGRNGFLALPGDALSFRDALQRAFALRSVWPKIRGSARAALRSRSWDSVISLFESYLVRAAMSRPGNATTTDDHKEIQAFA